MARSREVFIQMTADEQKAVEAFLRVDRSLKGTETSLAKASSSGRGFDRTLSSMSRTATSALSVLGVGGGLTGLLAAVGQGFQASAELNAKFTNEMRELLSLGDNLGNIQAVKDEVLSLSTTWGVSTESIARGMFQIQSGAANMSKAVQDDLMRTGLAMTEVYGGDLDQNLTSLLKTMQIFPGAINTASEAQGKLATMAELGFLNLRDLSGLLPDVIGPAAALGRSLDEVGAGLIVATRLGGSNEKTFTGLRNVFTMMNKAVEEGLTTNQSFIQQLQDLSQVGTEKLIKTFGNDAAPVLLNLVANVDQVTEALGQMEEGTGSAFDKLEQRANDAGAALEKTLRQIEQASQNLNKGGDFAAGGGQQLSAWQARKLGTKAGVSGLFGGMGSVVAEAPYLGTGIQGLGAIGQTITDWLQSNLQLTTRGIGQEPQTLLTSEQVGRNLAGLDLPTTNPTRAQQSAQRYFGDGGGGTIVNNTTIIQGGNFAQSNDVTRAVQNQRASRIGVN